MGCRWVGALAGLGLPLRRRVGALPGLVWRGWRVWPSQANFLLVRPPGGDAARIHRGLEALGVLVRYFDEPGLAETLRITVGTDEQHAVLLDALTRVG